MKVKYENSINYKVLERLNTIKGNVALRKDFADLGSARQVSRGLKKLIDDKKIIRLGKGIYAKAKMTMYYDKPIPCGGFDIVAREALDRLNIPWESGVSERAYNEGRSTQIPAKNIVRLKIRFRGDIQYEGRKIYFEKSVNSR